MKKVYSHRALNLLNIWGRGGGGGGGVLKGSKNDGVYTNGDHKDCSPRLVYFFLSKDCETF